MIPYNVSVLRRLKKKINFGRKFLSSSRENLLLFTILLIFATNIAICLKCRNKSTLRIIHYGEVTNDTSCYSAPSDNLPFADEQHFAPPAKSIFFHETSCKGGLNSRQACSIESAAMAHPKWQINLLFLGPVNQLSLKHGVMMKLQEFPNVKIFRINIAKFAQGTPVETMFSKIIFTTKDSLNQVSDILKYLTLFKWCGICLDLDVMVVQPFDSLSKNFATRQDDDNISSGVIALSRDKLGRNISKITIREVQNFRPDQWSYNGPGAMTRTLLKYCSTTDLTMMSAELCGGFEVYPPLQFYPIHYTHWDEYFKPFNQKVKENDIYAHHFWNYMNSNVKVPKDSFYARLAKEYCPNVFQMYGDDFGD